LTACALPGSLGKSLAEVVELFDDER